MTLFISKKLACDATEKFIKEDMGICIPLDYDGAYFEDGMDKEFQSKIIKFVSQNKFEVEVVSQIKAEGSTWSAEPWVYFIDSLKGQDVCFVSGWNKLQDYLKNIIPSSYNGDIVYRISNIPVLIEWNDTLLKHGSDRHTIVDLWEYGTWGYIVRSEYKKEFIEIVQLKTALSSSQIADFFQMLKCVFWVKGELDELWILNT